MAGLSFLLVGLLGFMRVVSGQELVNVNDGLGWDGVEYDKMLRLFRGDAQAGTVPAFPFCLRVGTPWLISNLSALELGFLEVNLLAGVIFVAAVIALTWRHSTGNVRSAVAMLFLSGFLFFAPAKFVNFYPSYVDPIFLLGIVPIAYLARVGRYRASLMLCLALIPFREAAFYVMPFVFLLGVLLKENGRAHLMFGGLAIVAGYAIVALLPRLTGCEPQSQILTGLHWLYRFMTEPERFVRCVAALLMTVGPLLVIMDRGDWVNAAKSPETAAGVMAIPYFAAISILGGSDVTRLFYSFFPMWALLTAAAFGRAGPLSFVISLFGLTLTNRVLEKYQQPLDDWPDLDRTGFFGQFPDHADVTVALAIIAVWMALAVLAYILRPFEELEVGRRESAAR